MDFFLGSPFLHLTGSLARPRVQGVTYRKEGRGAGASVGLRCPLAWAMKMARAFLSLAEARPARSAKLLCLIRTVHRKFRLCSASLEGERTYFSAVLVIPGPFIIVTVVFLRMRCMMWDPMRATYHRDGTSFRIGSPSCDLIARLRSQPWDPSPNQQAISLLDLVGAVRWVI